MTYVGSAESEKYDQVLDTVFVGPVAPGQYRFVFQVRGGVGHVDREPETSRQTFQKTLTLWRSPVQADPPDFSKIPSADIVGVTVILLTCSYKNQARGKGG